ncbi:MAG: EF-hand domain-containing protein [Pseudomonadota bacterium]|nr:EF-hand domain-containing protein [Pseudomonadota bacterium]
MKVLLGGTLAAAIAVAGVASLAHATRGGGHHGMGMRGMMERYDANKDGKLTQDEIDQNRSQWHGEFDADKSGGLTIAEFEALWLKARRDQLVREYQEFDRDGDGKLTLDEYKMPLAMMVQNRDMNGDGMLSRDDRRSRRDGDRDGGQKQEY